MNVCLLVYYFSNIYLLLVIKLFSMMFLFYIIIREHAEIFSDLKKKE